uniref:Uncharacterized protein n=1 Tax=Glossina palpalis gambiensis TaxID=67801 RepID=A0A1B0C2L0_9MUSC
MRKNLYTNVFVNEVRKEVFKDSVTKPQKKMLIISNFVRSLGPLDDVDTESEVNLLKHAGPHSKFSEGFLNCLPNMPWTIAPEIIYLVPDYAACVDLRGINICSVDPPGCTVLTMPYIVANY